MRQSGLRSQPWREGLNGYFVEINFFRGHGAIVFHESREVVVAAAAGELILPLSIVPCGFVMARARESTLGQLFPSLKLGRNLQPLQISHQTRRLTQGPVLSHVV